MGGEIEELQALESNLQGLLAQRQTIQLEINEIENALDELKDYKEEVFKLVSGMLIKAGKEKVIEELREKKKISEARMNAVEKQEKILEKKAEELRKRINSAS